MVGGVLVADPHVLAWFGHAEASSLSRPIRRLSWVRSCALSDRRRVHCHSFPSGGVGSMDQREHAGPAIGVDLGGRLVNQGTRRVFQSARRVSIAAGFAANWVRSRRVMVSIREFSSASTESANDLEALAVFGVR